MEIQKDFNEFFALFNAHKVEYVIVGGYALAFHGAPRYTGDIGVLVRADILDLDYGGVLVKVVGREALLINKRATGRTQDLADIEALEDQPD